MQVTIPGGIFYDTDAARYGVPAFRFGNGLTESYGTCVFIQAQDITVNVPDDFDPRPVEIQALEAREKALAAEFENARTAIRKRISELQAITFEAA